MPFAYPPLSCRRCFANGLTENAGHENDVPSKLQDIKLQDMKMTDQFSRYLQGMTDGQTERQTTDASPLYKLILGMS